MLTPLQGFNIKCYTQRVYKFLIISYKSMKKAYPTYRKDDLKNIFEGLTPNERKTINDFIKYCSIGSGEKKLQDIKRSVIQFLHITNKNSNEITLKDLRDYLSLLNSSKRKKYTTNGIKTHIKRFLKWKFKDWSERFEDLRDIKLVNGFNEEKINEGTILKKDEIEKIMQKETNSKRKTFFITLYESGLRPIELRFVKWKDIKFNIDGDISQLNIYATKTAKARSVYVKESTWYLKKLKEETKSDYVFPSVEDETKAITKMTALRWIKEMGKNGIDKDITPYLLRHSRATELYLNMPSKVAQKFLGHSKDMSDFYSHLSSKDVKESMLKTVYKLEDLPPEQEHELIREVRVLRESILIMYLRKLGKITAKEETRRLKELSEELNLSTIK